MNAKIAVLAGDGIGPEVMAETLRVLDFIAELHGHNFNYLPGLIGGAAFDVYQTHCPDDTLKICQEADCILFGSVGGPVAEQHHSKWQNCEANSILQLRKDFKLNINMRPITIDPHKGNASPLKNTLLENGVDCLIFRELTGGIYFGRHEQKVVSKQRIAIDECCYDEQQIASIAHAAFKAARMRPRKKVCSVDKANVLATSKLWREVVNEIANDYPDVELTHMLVDNCAMQLVINPQQFDVIVTENVFGDILSDLAAALQGSLGLIPSASLNAESYGLYEPAGGSAPDIAGQGIANPCAQILSAALMLRYSFGLQSEAQCIEQAVKRVIAKNIVTRDLSGRSDGYVTTRRFVDAVLSELCFSSH